tara:strand:+ start:240 stop:395 length:156 start_codon:yes stop_codon:yes gene_type:complete
MKKDRIRLTTAKADDLANLYWKTKDEKYKILWYQEIKRLSSQLDPVLVQEQ